MANTRIQKENLDVELPHSSSGAGAPGTTPAKVGDIYVDTTNDKIYVATATASSADWTLVNGAGGSTPKNLIAYPFEDVLTSGNRYSFTVTGSGVVANNQGGAQANTEATDGSSAMLMATGSVGLAPTESLYDNNPEILAFTQMVNRTDQSCVSQFMTGGTLCSSAHVLTSKHFGFIVDITGGTTVIYASNANGTTQTLTDISSGISADNFNTYRAVMVSGTSIKFYVNKTLKATHTTNLPSGAFTANLLNFGVKTDAGVTTAVKHTCHGISLLWDAE